jgi:hypothetical protein
LLYVDSRKIHSLEETQILLGMKLFRRNKTAWRFVLRKGNAIHAYLGCNIIAIQKQLVGIASLDKYE